MSTTPDGALQASPLTGSPTASRSAADLQTADFQFDDAETRRRLDSGELYVDFGPGLEELDAQRTRGKVLAERFHATSAADAEARTAIARELFASFGESWLETPIYLAYQGHTSIGNDCWLGANVTVLPGVTIGEGSVIASGALVNRDVPPHSLAAGVPGRVLRELTEDERERDLRGFPGTGPMKRA